MRSRAFSAARSQKRAVSRGRRIAMPGHDPPWIQCFARVNLRFRAAAQFETSPHAAAGSSGDRQTGPSRRAAQTPELPTLRLPPVGTALSG